MQTRYGFQYLVQIRGSHYSDVLGSDYRSHRWGAAQCLLAAGGNANGIFVTVCQSQFFFLGILSRNKCCVEQQCASQN